MSFMEQPQPDACRALMPTPENPPPGPPSRPIVCYMPKGHDETDGHAETRLPGPLTRRWHGDARVPVIAVDRPDNGQDEGRVLIARCENYREDLDQPCTGTLRYRCGMIQAACDTCGGYCGVAVARWTEVTSRRAGAGEQQRERVARWLAANLWINPALTPDPPEGDPQWLELADELLTLLGGPQPDGR